MFAAIHVETQSCRRQRRENQRNGDDKNHPPKPRGQYMPKLASGDAQPASRLRGNSKRASSLNCYPSSSPAKHRESAFQMSPPLQGGARAVPSPFQEPTSTRAARSVSLPTIASLIELWNYQFYPKHHLFFFLCCQSAPLR
jgi:hypothetical protein